MCFPVEGVAMNIYMSNAPVVFLGLGIALIVVYVLTIGVSDWRARKRRNAR